MFKAVNIFFCIIFLIFTGLQWNDPDPYLWMPLYLLSVCGCVFALKDMYLPKFYLSVIAIYVAYDVFLFFTDDGVWSWMSQHNFQTLTGSMKATEPWVENTREFGGLLISIVVMSFDFLILRLKAQSKHPV